MYVMKDAQIHFMPPPKTESKVGWRKKSPKMWFKSKPTSQDFFKIQNCVMIINKNLECFGPWGHEESDTT